MDYQTLKDQLGKEIIEELYENRMILTWYRDNPAGWTLASGMWSPFYIQLREISSYPNLLKKIAHAMGNVLKHELSQVNLIIGLAMAGIPIATALSLETNIPMAFTRKVEGDLNDFEGLIHRYGKHSLIEGRLSEDRNMVLVDDLVSYFSSKVQGLQIIKYEMQKRNIKNYLMKHIIVLIDREQGGQEEAIKHGVELHSLIPFKSRAVDWLKDKITSTEYTVIQEYLNDPMSFQNEDQQNRVSQLVEER